MGTGRPEQQNEERALLFTSAGILTPCLPMRTGRQQPDWTGLCPQLAQVIVKTEASLGTLPTKFPKRREARQQEVY